MIQATSRWLDRAGQEVSCQRPKARGQVSAQQIGNRQSSIDSGQAVRGQAVRGQLVSHFP